jgi:hypothetical protein
VTGRQEAVVGRTLGFGTRRQGLALACLVAATATSAGDDPNVCDEPGEFPDVIVAEIFETRRWGGIGSLTAFTIGTTSCNVGTCWLNWSQSLPDHPVIGQNMYRLRDGRFEQLGQSWLKHGFAALSEQVCFTDCVTTDGTHLGVHCSDPYSAFLNGLHNRLGPKFEVNATTGAFPFPPFDFGGTGDDLHKRLRVENDDLEPDLNPGAKYWVEAQYVTLDDATAGKQDNNASHRRIDVLEPASGFYDIALTGVTKRHLPGILAWKIEDPSVTLSQGKVTGDGLFYVASKATSNGNGTWSYEYAVQNLNSHRSGRSFSVPLPFGLNVSATGFHDVDYHSGEPYDLTDWSVTNDGERLTWSTATFAENQNANALRWGTLYNFRYVADFPPVTGSVTIGLFRPGSPETLSLTAVVPRFCDQDGVCDGSESCTTCPSDCSNQSGGGGCCGDGVCNAGESSCSCLRDCGPSPVEEFLCSDGEDDDCDGLSDCDDPDCCSDAACVAPDADGDSYAACDCNDGNPTIWARPCDVESLTLDRAGPNVTLSWLAPLEPGAQAWSYDVLRSSNPVNFLTSTECLADGNPTDTTAGDSQAIAPGGVHYYLVRAVNTCPVVGVGTLGRSSDNVVQLGRTCP